MSASGPILILEDDLDDQELITEAFSQLGVKNKLVFFITGVSALEYLLVTTEQPFLILTDMNLPLMNGLQFHETILNNDYLKRKSIPFVFFTTTGNRSVVRAAYDQSVQGFFQKPADFKEIVQTLKSIVDYWQRCLHPNNIDL